LYNGIEETKTETGKFSSARNIRIRNIWKKHSYQQAN